MHELRDKDDAKVNAASHHQRSYCGTIRHKRGGALFGIIIGAVMMFAMGCICYAMNR